MNSNTTQHTITNTYCHDHAGRLLETWQNINDGDELLVSKLEYDKPGQLTAKKRRRCLNLFFELIKH